MNPVNERIKDQTTNHKPAIKSFGVNFLRVPFAEHIICAFVNRMQVVMRSHVETELSHPTQ